MLSGEIFVWRICYKWKIFTFDQCTVGNVGNFWLITKSRFWYAPKSWFFFILAPIFSHVFKGPFGRQNLIFWASKLVKNLFLRQIFCGFLATSLAQKFNFLSFKTGAKIILARKMSHFAHCDVLSQLVRKWWLSYIHSFCSSCHSWNPNLAKKKCVRLWYAAKQLAVQGLLFVSYNTVIIMRRTTFL